MQHVHHLLETKTIHARGILGQGIGIAIIDTGIAPHPDLTRNSPRIRAFYDVTEPQNTTPRDENGHGTHVAGIAAGDGVSSDGLYCGIAPASNLIGIRILNRDGNGKMTDILPSFSWILQNRTKYNIRIVNISIGCSSVECMSHAEDSLLVKGVNELWDAGLVVVAAAGNEGPTPMSITAPGISRKIITVGASDDAQGFDIPESRRRSKSSPPCSGRGPTTNCIRKPDIVAPGNRIISCRTTGGYIAKSGTSMSTPMVSGAIALLLSRQPDLSNLEVKIRLKNSAVDLGLPHERQGWGLLNIRRLLGY